MKLVNSCWYYMTITSDGVHYADSVIPALEKGRLAVLIAQRRIQNMACHTSFSLNHTSIKVSSSSSSSRSPTRPVQQQWWSWWSSLGPPSPHIISGEANLLMATVRFALVGVCYISEEHARLSGPPHHRDTLGEGTSFSFLCMCALSLLWPYGAL